MKKKQKSPKPLFSQQWSSESTRAVQVDPPPDPSASGTTEPPPAKGVSLNVTPAILCCGSGTPISANASATGPGASNADVTLNYPGGSKSGKGSVSYDYVVKESDCGTWLEFGASANGKTKTARVAVVKVTISAVGRVPIFANLPANERSCNISILPNDVELTAKIERVSGEGSIGLAAFAQGGTSISVKGDVSVKVRGVQNSDQKDNMRIIVPVAGKNCGERRFSVRTWPRQGMFLTPPTKPSPGVLWFEVRWFSETNDVADLAPKVWVGEVVAYNPPLPVPPYAAAPPNPTILKWLGTQAKPALPKLGWGTDKQLVPVFGTPLSENIYTASQILGFWDEVLEGAPTETNVHTLQGNISIERTITQDGEGRWIYRVKKLGVVSDPYIIP